MLRPLAALLIGALSVTVSPAGPHDGGHMRGERLRFHGAGARPGVKVAMIPQSEAAGPSPEPGADEDPECEADVRAMLAAAPVVAWLLSGMPHSRG